MFWNVSGFYMLCIIVSIFGIFHPRQGDGSSMKVIRAVDWQHQPWVVGYCSMYHSLMFSILNSLVFVTMTNTGKYVDKGIFRWGCLSYQIVDALVCSMIDLIGNYRSMLLYVTGIPLHIYTTKCLQKRSVQECS